MDRRIAFLLVAASAAAEERPAVVPLRDLGLVDKALHEDDPAQNWVSEKASDAAAAVLTQLGERMAHPGKAGLKPLKDLAAAQVAFTPLRPAQFSQVFQADGLSVQRSPGGGPKTRGIPALEAALESALPEAKESAEAWVKFKIVRVHAGAASWETEAVCQAAVHSAAGHLQTESTWTCRWQPRGDNPPLLLEVTVTACEESRFQRAAPAFADCTEAAFRADETWRAQFGRDTDFWSERIEQRFFADSSGWQGVSLGDVNGDGLDDLYLPQSGGLPNRLYLHQPDGTLRDITKESGTGWWDHTNAAIFADFDNDGDQDLALGLLFGVVFMQNDGKGHFTVAASSITPEAQPYSLAAADYDNDGDLDLYAACYSPRAIHAGNRFLARPVPYHDANNGGRNVLLRNDRSWQFHDATKSAGMDENNRRFSLACAWEDFDNDGDQDIHVANDFGRDNLYRNDGPDKDGITRFHDAAPELGVDDIGAGMSVAWGDADRDGFMDLYVSNMWSSAGHRVTGQDRFLPGKDSAVRAEFQHHAAGNSLFHNDGGRRFTSIAESSGTALARWAWGSVFLDINNDGWQDLYAVNGYFTRPDPGDL